MKKLGCILLFCLGCCAAQAQSPFQLSGKITDSAGIALSHATVCVIILKDTIQTLTRDDGSFVISNLPSGKFRVLVTMKGYRSFIQSYDLPEEKHAFELGNVPLAVIYKDLEAVVVSHLTPITIHGDTVSYNVAAFPVRDGAEVEDVLKRLPGVEVDMDGNVIVQGKRIKKVMVNGKDFFGGNVLLAIRNLPADVVAKLQIIDDYGDKARLTGVRSGESAKVLNIDMKADKRHGAFGSVEAGAGEYGKYLGSAFANIFKGDRQISINGELRNNSLTGNDPAYQAGINYEDQWNAKWSGGGIASLYGQDSHSSGSSIQDNFYSNEQLHQTQSNLNSSHSDSRSFSGAFSYRPDSYSTLKFSGSVSQQSSLNQSSSNFTTFQQTDGYNKSTEGSSVNKTQASGKNITSDIYYEKLSSHSRKRFFAQFTTGYSDSRQSADNFSSAVVDYDSTSSISVLHYLVANTSTNLNLDSHAGYFLPLGKSSFLEIDYNFKSTRSNTDLITRQPGISGPPAIIDSLSQHQIFLTLTQDLRVGYTGHLNKLDISAGMEGQPGMLSGSNAEKGTIESYSYFSLTPRLEAAWSFNNSHKINLDYGSQTNLPSLNQLSPFTNVTNPQYPVIGNPNLRSSHTNNIGIHYEQSAIHGSNFFGFGTGLSYYATGHSIISNITHPKDSTQVIQRTTYINAGTASVVQLEYHLTLPSFFNNRLRINTSGNFSQSQAPTMTDDLLYNTRNWAWNQALSLQWMVPDVIETRLEGSYAVTHSVYPNSESLQNLFKSASLSLNIRQYLFKRLILNCELSQPYTSRGSGLQRAPTTMSADIRCEFLRHHKATMILNGFNLLNSAAGVWQSSSSTSVTQTSVQVIGRYFFLTFQLKLNHFSS